MKFKHAPKNAKEGDKRIRRGFLIFPKQLEYETRWLEVATWEEELKSGYEFSWWEATRWVDDASEH